VPYASNAELPAYVKKLPEGKQSQWRSIFNSCVKDGGDESRCFRMANGVVKRKETEWELGEEPVESDQTELDAAEKNYQYVESYEYESRKLPQDQAGYNPVGGDNNKACSNCMFFVSPARCTVVSGEIAPNGLSEQWRATPEYKPAPVPVIVVGDEWLNEEKLARTEMSASSFAYIDSNGGRHLPIHDAAHVRNALARFNQTKFESADAKKRARAKIMAAAKRFGIETGGSKSVLGRLAELFTSGTPDPAPAEEGVTAPSLPETQGVFGVVKQTDGKLRWFARYSNAWEDRDQEILTEAAHKDYIEWAYETGTFPELWLWHTGGTRFGEADWLDFSDGFAHASGLIDNGKESVVESISAKDVGVSHGFLSLQQGKYVSRYRTYEISVLPREWAAVETSGFNVLDATKESEVMAFTEERRKWLVEALGEDAVGKLEKSTESMATQLKELGVEYKEAEEAKKADAEASSEGYKALAEQVASLTTVVGQLAGVVTEQKKQLDGVQKSDDEKIEDAFLARVAKAFGQNGGVTRPTEDTKNIDGAAAAPAGAEQTDFFSSMIAEQLGYATKNAGTAVGTPAMASVNVDASSQGPTEVRGE
jgi:hypothetical protein